MKQTMRRFVVSVTCMILVTVAVPMTAYASSSVGHRSMGGGASSGGGFVDKAMAAADWLNPTTPGGLGSANPFVPGGFDILAADSTNVGNMTALADAADRAAKALASVTENLASINDLLPELMKKGGIILVVLLIALILFFIIMAFGLKGISKARNNPAALQRLQMMHAHKEKIAQVATMKHFD